MKLHQRSDKISPADLDRRGDMTGLFAVLFQDESHAL
jgi:hypothetical protein